MKKVSSFIPFFDCPLSACAHVSALLPKNMAGTKIG
jgi:hypothetical protein